MAKRSVVRIHVRPPPRLQRDPVFSPLSGDCLDPVHNDHRAWGFVLAGLAVVALVLALVAREPRRILTVAGVLVVLTVIAQSALAALGERNRWLGGLHALDGMAILVLSGWMAGLGRQRLRARRDEVVPEAEEVRTRDAA